MEVALTLDAVVLVPSDEWHLLLHAAGTALTFGGIGE